MFVSLQESQRLYPVDPAPDSPRSTTQPLRTRAPLLPRLNPSRRDTATRANPRRAARPLNTSRTPSTVCPCHHNNRGALHHLETLHSLSLLIEEPPPLRFRLDPPQHLPDPQQGVPPQQGGPPPPGNIAQLISFD